MCFQHFFIPKVSPGTIIDAYAAGLPVISSRWESYDDVIEDNITGIGYEFGNDEALIDILETVKCDPQKLIDMKENCLRKAKEFSPRAIVGGFIQKFF